MNLGKKALLLMLLCFFALAGLHAAFGVSPAWAQEGWKEEFDNVCAETDVAMTLSIVQMCQDLYRYVLQSKNPDR